MTDAREAQARLALRFGPLHPLAAGSKVPVAGRGVYTSSRDEAEVKRWIGQGLNVGLSTAAVLVVDVDPRNGGHTSLDALTATHGPLPDGPLQHTAGGGTHRFFVLPELPTGRRFRARLDAPGIDIKAGAGAYVVVAPSTVGGAPYHWGVRPDEEELPQLPGWLLELATVESRPFDGRASGPVAEALLAHAFARAGMLRHQIDDDRIAVVCPWEHEHTSAPTRRDSSTVVFGPMQGHDLGGFLCFHSHCEHRRSEEALDALPREAVDAARRDVASRYHARAASTEPMPEHNPPPPRYPRTDLGNAERLVDRHRSELRYVAGLGWHAWDGTRWRFDDTGEVMRKAQLTVRAIYGEAQHVEDETVRKEIARWATTSESASKLAAMVKLAEHDKAIICAAKDLDADPWALNVANGTIDLRTGELRPHNRDELHTKVAPVAYDPSARAPTFERFVSEVFAGSEAEARFLQRFVGYALTGLVDEQCLLLAVGDGSNGKSTLFETLRELLGDYSTSAMPGLLIERKHDAHPTERMDLMGARLVTCTELNEGNRFDEALVKQLTGGDSIKARRMHRDPVDFRPTHKLVILANHMPEVRGTDHGIWRRLYPLPFPVRFEGCKRDNQLAEKLRSELPGILRWAVEGCLAWRRERALILSPGVRKAIDSYRRDQDVVGRFLSERCIVEPDAWASKASLYEAWTEWQRAEGEAEISPKAFGIAIGRGRGFRDERDSKMRRWVGVRLMSAAEREAASRWSRGAA